MTNLHHTAKHEPFISIVVPVYNAMPYLSQALASLRAQTESNFEVLLIDDGSTDDSLAVLQDAAAEDARFKVIAKPNEGYGATVNRGFVQARGTYIGIFEPDDVLDEHALETLGNLARQTQADVVKANYWFYWGESGKNRLMSPVHADWTERPFCASEHPEVLFSVPSIWSALYKREWLDVCGLRLLETPGASYQDLGFSFKAFASAHTIAATMAPVLHYRQDNAASSVNNAGKAFAVCAELDSIDEFVGADEVRTWMAPYAYRLRYDSFMWNFGRLTGDARAEFLPRMFEDLALGAARGACDPKLFSAWQQANLEALLKDPERFLQRFPKRGTPVAKTLYYLRLSGMRGVADALRTKVVKAR